MSGKIRVGIGGWTFEPWRGVFYPDDLPQKRELEFASRAVNCIEINGTYYSTFKPDSWKKWRDETPDDFVFAVKASRYCTNRRELKDAGPSIEKFLHQGLADLGPKLGPINWQFMATKKFDATDFGAFLALLPKSLGNLKLRHAVEVRHDSFATPAFIALAKEHDVAIVYAKDEDFPEIEAHTTNFTYARFMATDEKLKNGVGPKDLKALASQAKTWSKRGDVFAFFIAGAKEKNPAAAMALLKDLE